MRIVFGEHRDVRRRIQNRVATNQLFQHLAVHCQQPLSDGDTVGREFVLAQIAVPPDKVVGLPKRLKLYEKGRLAIRLLDAGALQHTSGDLFRSQSDQRKNGRQVFVLRRDFEISPTCNLKPLAADDHANESPEVESVLDEIVGQLF